MQGVNQYHIPALCGKGFSEEKSEEKRENFHTKGQRGEGTRRGMPQILKDFEIKRNVVRVFTNHGFKIKFVDGGNL
jgi:hypothetical protein